MTKWKPRYTPEECPRPVAAMSRGGMQQPPWCVNCAAPLDESGVEHDSPWNSEPCQTCGGYLFRHPDIDHPFAAAESAVRL